MLASERFFRALPLFVSKQFTRVNLCLVRMVFFQHSIGKLDCKLFREAVCDFGLGVLNFYNNKYISPCIMTEEEVETLPYS